MRVRRHLLVCVIVALASFPLWAQGVVEPVATTFSIYLWPNQTALNENYGLEQAPAPGAQTAPVAGMTGEAISLFYLESGAGSEKKIELDVGMLTESFDYRGPETLVFYRREIGSEREDGIEPVAEVNLPRGESKIVLFFFAQPDHTFAVMPLAYPAVELARGGSVICNLSSVSLGTRIGQNDFLLAPGAVKALPASGASDIYQHLQVSVRNAKGKWVRSLGRTLLRSELQGRLILLYPIGGNPERLNMKTLTLN